MVRIAKVKHLNIYSNFNGGYIVHNTKKEFSEGHTHINNYKTAKYIAYLAANKKLPKGYHLSKYLTESIVRISDDNQYIYKITHMEEIKKGKRN